MRRLALLTAAAVVSLASVATVAFARPKHGHSARAPRASAASAIRADASGRPDASGRADALGRADAPGRGDAPGRTDAPARGRETQSRISAGAPLPALPASLPSSPSRPEVSVARSDGLPRSDGTSPRSERGSSELVAERDGDPSTLSTPPSRAEGARGRQRAAQGLPEGQADFRLAQPAPATAPALPASGRPAATVTVTAVEVEGGEVPRAQASLERLASSELAACTTDPSLLRGEATLRVKFLVRGLGRVEGLDLTEAHGVPRSVARCMMATLDARHLGDASDDPVAFAVTFRLAPRR